LGANREKTAGAGPVLNLNLQVFFFAGLGLVLFFSPFLRGLFFDPELFSALILVAVSFAFCVYDQVLRRGKLTIKEPLDLAVLSLVLAYALSLLTAVHMRAAVRELLTVTAYFMVYWMACRAAKDQKGFNTLIIINYLAGAGVAAIGLGAAAGVINYPGAYEGGRMMSTFQYPNSLAVYLAALNIAGLALSVKTEKLLYKLLYAAGNLLMVVVIIGTQSRGGWVLYPLAAAGFIFLIHPGCRWRALYHWVIFLGCGLVTGRSFFNSLGDVQGAAALRPMLVGLAAVLIFQAAYHFLGVWLNRETVEERTRRLIAAGGIAYLGVVFLVYLWYAAFAFPVPAANIVPSKAIVRAQKISIQEISFQARLQFSRDALKIVKDYPVTGAGGGGWEALYHSYASRLYWTTEVHNHFFQTWVEAGTLGFLVFLAIWILFLRLLLRFRQKGEEEPDQNVLVWGTAVAVLLLGMHSLLDFDLSLPALGLMLFAFMGAVRGRVGTGKNKNKGGSSRLSPGKMIAIAVLGSLLSAAVAYPAYSFYVAGTAGAEGARALLAKDLERARAFYEQAVKRDPFTASYWADLAQIFAVKAKAKDDAVSHYRAIDCARRAAEAEPYNTRVRGALVNVYRLLGEYGLAVEEARALAKANPLLGSNYEILAAAMVDAAENHIETGAAEKAGPYLLEILEMEEDLPVILGKVPPAVTLAAGKAAFLLGELERSQYLLGAVAGSDNDLAYQARIWLAAVYSAAGKEDKSRQALEIPVGRAGEAYAQYESLMQLYREAGKIREGK